MLIIADSGSTPAISAPYDMAADAVASGLIMTIEALSVLVVDDDAFQRRLLRRQLASLGVREVVEARDGRDALDKMQSPGAAFQIVVSDVDMPNLDGMTLLRALSERDSNVALILLSALDEALLRSVERLGTEHGLQVLGAVSKPISTGDLKALLLRWVDNVKSDREPLDQPVTAGEVFLALEHDEFEAFYQPKVRLADGALLGAEVLARWHHPTRGVVMPGTFVPIMEKLDLIGRLTEVMLHKSAHTLASLGPRAAPLHLSVNISLSSLADIDIADQYDAIVRDAGVSPSQFILEITEQAAATDAVRTLENLARLRIRGFRLSIDDFGTGYSTLHQLLRFPFSELKIDREFITGVHRDSPTWTMIEASLRMAEKIHLNTVAEGVETQSEWDALISLGCHAAQGFLVARPLMRVDFEAFVRARRIANLNDKLPDSPAEVLLNGLLAPRKSS